MTDKVVFRFDGFVRDAEVIRVIEGDTIDLTIDLGYESLKRVRARLNGIDTSEWSRTGSRIKSVEAAQNLRRLIEEYGNPRIGLHRVPTLYIGVESTLVPSDLRGKYGRYLVILWGYDRVTGEQVNLNERMVADGHAVRQACK